MKRKLTCLIFTLFFSLASYAVCNVTDRFKNQVVFITGGTSGIGLATAVQFAKQGAAHVIVCSRTTDEWKKAQPYINSHLSPLAAKRIAYWPCDVRVESTIKSIIQKIYRKYGRLDVAFNNAGVSPGDVSTSGNIENYDFPSQIQADGSIAYVLHSPQPGSKKPISSAWKANNPTQATKTSPYRENVLATNVLGTFYCLKWELGEAFAKQPKNIPLSIINNASRNGIIPSPNRPLYGAAKAFMISLTRSLSAQAAIRSVKQGRAMIRVNAIAPGPVDTPLERSAFPGKNFVKAMTGVPMQRIATPEEIAPAVLFLADPKQSSYITGAILPVDGGDVASPYMVPPVVK